MGDRGMRSSRGGSAPSSVVGSTGVKAGLPWHRARRGQCAACSPPSAAASISRSPINPPKEEPMPIAHVNGIDLNYKLEGEGDETIVLVNGLADDLETWVLQMEDMLGAGYRVLRFDNRGVGQSSAPAGPYTTELFAKDAKARVDELGLRDFHLVGVSMGGMIAQEYAVAFAAGLRSLTLACTYAATGPFCTRMFS